MVSQKTNPEGLTSEEIMNKLTHLKRSVMNCFKGPTVNRENRIKLLEGYLK